MTMIRYNAKRCCAASRTPWGPKDTLVCMVMIELPDGGVTPLVIPEDQILEHAKGDVVQEELFIQQKVRQVITSLEAGAVGDIRFEQLNPEAPVQ